jgi:hypothetical protein
MAFVELTRAGISVSPRGYRVFGPRLLAHVGFIAVGCGLSVSQEGFWYVYDFRRAE